MPVAAPDKIRFRCPHCDAVNQADPELANKPARCRACSKAMRVPGSQRPQLTAEPVEFRCAECGLVKPAPSKLAGRKVKCPNCDSAGRIPTGLQPKRAAQRYRSKRREEPRPEEARREEPRRNEPRREEPRPEEARREEPRRDEPRGRRRREVAKAERPREEHDASPYSPPDADVASQDAQVAVETQVPIVLKVYGGLIMGFQSLYLLALFAVLTLAVLNGQVPLLGVIPIAVTVVLFRLGLGLWRGQKQAVIGVGILAALNLGFAGLVLVKGGVLVGLLLGAQACVLLVPPVVVGALNWKKLPA